MDDVQAARTYLRPLGVTIGWYDTRKGGNTVHLGLLPVGVQSGHVHSIEIYFKYRNRPHSQQN